MTSRWSMDLSARGADLLGGLPQRPPLARADKDLRSLARVGHGDRLADAPAPARDKRHFAVQNTHNTPFLCTVGVSLSLCVQLPAPSSEPYALARHYPDYSSSMGWSDFQSAIAASSPLQVVHHYSLFGERPGSPRFQLAPSNTMPLP